MDYGSLPFREWEQVPIKLAWGEGIPDQERKFYRNKGKFYKLWGENYNIKNLYVSNGKYLSWNYKSGKESVAAIDIGFVRQDIAPGLIDLIWDDQENCRGYVMYEGKPIESIPNDFYQKIRSVSIQTGYFHTDLTPKNVALFDGVPGLIDFDTPLTCTNNLDLNFEAMKGVLREHIDSRYRSLAIKCFQELNVNRQ